MKTSPLHAAVNKYKTKTKNSFEQKYNIYLFIFDLCNIK